MFVAKYDDPPGVLGLRAFPLNDILNVYAEKANNKEKNSGDNGIGPSFLNR